MGWEVTRRDGCTIKDNPLSMDGILLEWMRFPAKDGW